MTSSQSALSDSRTLAPRGPQSATFESSTQSTPGACTPLAHGVCALLDELAVVLSTLSSEAYCRASGPEFFAASPGGHVRHCLDHIRALCDGVADRTIRYDRRERGTAIEQERAAALAEITRLRTAVLALAPLPINLRLQIELLPSRHAPLLLAESTLARELAFVLSHTIHHNALVRAMAGATCFPPTFGLAPATIAHHDARDLHTEPAPCAR